MSKAQKRSEFFASGTDLMPQHNRLITKCRLGKTEKQKLVFYDLWQDKYRRKIISAYVRPKGVENNSPYQFVYRFITSDDTYLIKDQAHAYFYHKQIVDLAAPLIPKHVVIVKDKSYIRIYGLERRLRKWTGKESLKQYLKEQDN